MKQIGIYYNEPGLREIMKGQAISNMEQEIMAEKLSQVRADFLQTFGFNGAFEVKRFETQSKRSRVAFKIVASDKRTAAVLKTQPGWLGKFL